MRRPTPVPRRSVSTVLRAADVAFPNPHASCPIPICAGSPSQSAPAPHPLLRRLPICHGQLETAGQLDLWQLPMPNVELTDRARAGYFLHQYKRHEPSYSPTVARPIFLVPRVRHQLAADHRVLPPRRVGLHVSGGVYVFLQSTHDEDANKSNFSSLVADSKLAGLEKVAEERELRGNECQDHLPLRPQGRRPVQRQRFQSHLHPAFYIKFLKDTIGVYWRGGYHLKLPLITQIEPIQIPGQGLHYCAEDLEEELGRISCPRKRMNLIRIEG